MTIERTTIPDHVAAGDRTAIPDHVAAGLGVVALLTAAAGFYFPVIELIYLALGIMIAAFTLFYRHPFIRMFEKRALESRERTSPARKSDP